MCCCEHAWSLPSPFIHQVRYLLAQARKKGSTTLIAADASSSSSSSVMRQEASAGGALGEKRELHTAWGASTPVEYDTHVLKPKRRRPSPKKRAHSSKETDPGVTSGLHQARQASTDRQQQAPEWALQPGMDWVRVYSVCPCVYVRV